MFLIVSSFWLEFYSGTKNSKIISDLLNIMGEIIVPTIVIIEIFKKIIALTSEAIALKFMAQMRKGKIIELIFELSLNLAYC